MLVVLAAWISHLYNGLYPSASGFRRYSRSLYLSVIALIYFTWVAVFSVLDFLCRFVCDSFGLVHFTLSLLYRSSFSSTVSFMYLLYASLGRINVLSSGGCVYRCLMSVTSSPVLWSCLYWALIQKCSDTYALECAICSFLRKPCSWIICFIYLSKIGDILVSYCDEVIVAGGELALCFTNAFVYFYLSINLWWSCFNCAALDELSFRLVTILSPPSSSRPSFSLPPT